MSSPEEMRRAVAGYVQEIHRACAAQAMTLPPAVRGRMALLSGGRLSVAAVAVRNLHLLATVEGLGPPRDPEVAALAEDPDPDPDAVREAVLTSVGGRSQWQPPVPADSASQGSEQ